MAVRIPEENIRRMRNYDPNWAIPWVERWLTMHAEEVGDQGFRGWVYFVQARKRDPIKIGYASTSVRSRVQELQVASPYKLNVLCAIRGSRSVEAFLHQTFEHWRLNGEWFKASAFGLLELIDHLGMRLPV